MNAKPFVVNVAALRLSASGRHHVRRNGRLEGLEITSSSVPAESDVVVDADLEVVDGGVVVTGTVSSTWVGECRRCLRLVTGELATPVREVFERVTRDREGAVSGVEDADTYPLTGDTLDMAPLVRDALLLELPLAPLCRPDCAGLCPQCGADLFEQPCGCAVASGHPGWAALDSLRDRAPGNGAPAGAARGASDQARNGGSDGQASD